jgi:hypothetical protein
MANPEHLQILKQGVEVWYVWRVCSGVGVTAPTQHIGSMPS